MVVAKRAKKRRYHIVLDVEQVEALKVTALARSLSTGQPVTWTELVREFIQKVVCCGS